MNEKVARVKDLLIISSLFILLLESLPKDSKISPILSLNLKWHI